MATSTSLLHARTLSFLFGLMAILGIPFVGVSQTTTTARPDLPPISPINPTMAGTRLDNDRESLYAQFNDYKRNPNPEQQRFAYPTAKEFLRLFGGENTSEVKEVRKWVTEYERQA